MRSLSFDLLLISSGFVSISFGILFCFSLILAFFRISLYYRVYIYVSFVIAVVNYFWLNCSFSIGLEF